MKRLNSWGSVAKGGMQQWAPAPRRPRHWLGKANAAVEKSADTKEVRIGLGSLLKKSAGPTRSRGEMCHCKHLATSGRGWEWGTSVRGSLHTALKCLATTAQESLQAQMIAVAATTRKVRRRGCVEAG